MFYTSFPYRQTDTFKVPKGPSLRRKPIRVSICGTTLKFRSPKLRGRTENTPKPTYEDLNELGFSPGYFDRLSDGDKKSNCGFKNIYKQFFEFNGPWFTGKMGSIILTIFIVKLEKYPATVSAFHPRSLEMFIGDYLSTYYSETDEYNGYIQEYNAPVNWQALSGLPVNAAQLNIMLNITNRPGGHIEHLVFVPIEDRLVIKFRFQEFRRGLLPTCVLDKLISREPMKKLIDEIIASIDIQLSPEAKMQQEKALEGLEDTRLVDNYPPIKWDNLDDETRAKILERDRLNRIAEYGC